MRILLPLLTVFLLLLLPPSVRGALSRTAEDLNVRPVAPEVCRTATHTSLTLVQPWYGNLEKESVRCFEVTLEAGEFVRAVADKDSEYSEWTGVTIELFAPGDTQPMLRLSMGDRRSLSWEAARSGSYFLVLRDLWILQADTNRLPARVWIESVKSPAQVTARREALTTDPRVNWLREHALAVRSISPDDLDFSDLEPLRAELDGVRLVLLGEADHASGTDFLARTRLVKFLHRELGFDVLAFESGLYGMRVAWDSIRAGWPARNAFVKGNFGFWSTTEQIQPLITYVGEQALGSTPLEVAGFDNRPWLYWPNWNTSLTRFAEDLAKVLSDRAVPGPLADQGTPEYTILERLSARRYWDVALPEPDERRRFLDVLDQTTAALENLADDESRFWAETLRGVGCHAREVFISVSKEGELEPECLRDHQMGEHLIWLANDRYSDRKIIAWAATSHILRDPEFEQVGGTGPAMGQRVWDALGEQSYAIGMTSYSGAANHIVTDQHPLPEFEQLMEVSGFDHAIVQLRNSAVATSWVRGPFFARPLGHRTQQRVWSDELDALFFVRLQEPRRWMRGG